jgi:hypothetical protein
MNCIKTVLLVAVLIGAPFSSVAQEGKGRGEILIGVWIAPKDPHDVSSQIKSRLRHSLARLGFDTRQDDSGDDPIVSLLLLGHRHDVGASFPVGLSFHALYFFRPGKTMISSLEEAGMDARLAKLMAGSILQGMYFSSGPESAWQGTIDRIVAWLDNETSK